MEDFISTKEAAKLADLSKEHIGWLLRHGKIEGRKIGRDWVVSRASVEAYARQWHKPGPKREQGRPDS
jgi:excisionase family DNA binding protein